MYVGIKLSNWTRLIVFRLKYYEEIVIFSASIYDVRFFGKDSLCRYTIHKYLNI